ncbi:MAG: Zn-ribbon domain-containing OB-fold protein [Dehalococcoidia bacterium]
MAEYSKPLPYIHEETRFFWEKARGHELWLQQCNDCGKFRFYPRSICPECFSYNTLWTRVSGRGKIYSFTVSYRPASKAFKADVLYNIAIIELEEGVRMLSNIVECRNDDIRIDMSVEVVFDDVTPEVTLIRFRPQNPAIRV